MKKRRFGRLIAASAALWCLSLIATRGVAAVYEVGEGKPYTAIGQVPWESLDAGDTRGTQLHSQQRQRRQRV